MITLDRLAQVNAYRVGPAAYTLLDKLQQFTPEEQVAGFAVAFNLLCRKLQCHQGNALQVAERILQESGKKIPEIRGFLMYLEKEIT